MRNKKDKTKGCITTIKFLRKLKNVFRLILNLLIYIFSIINKRSILIDTPTHGNLGDHAIVMAEKECLKKLNKTFVELTATEINNHEKIFAFLTRKDKVIIVHGGGFLGDLWPDEEERFRRILDAFKNNKIIVFPQTITFDMKTDKGYQYFKKSKCIYSAHENLTLFVRECKSLNFMEKYMPKIKTILVPDIVTLLSVDKNPNKRCGILFCMRSDREKSIKEEILANIICKMKDKYPTYDIKYTDTVLHNSIKPDTREEEVRKKLDQFSCAKMVITDRLHGMVFAAITNTPCIAFSNSNRKVKGVYEWIKDNEYIQYAESDREFYEVLERLDLEKEYEYNRSGIEDAFIPLYKELEGE